MTKIIDPTNLFLEYYNQKTDTDKKVIRARVIVNCNISYASFFRKLRENSWTYLEQKEICRLCDIGYDKFFLAPESPIIK